MAENFNDQELSEIFRKRLPPQPIPPDVDARIRQRVMMEVALLRADAPSVESTAPSSEPNTPLVRPQPRVARRQPVVPQGFWPRLWSQLRERLTMAPSLAFAATTAAILLTVLLYGRDFLRDFSTPPEGNTGSAAIETLPSNEVSTEPDQATATAIALADSPTPAEESDPSAEAPTSEESDAESDTPTVSAGEDAPANEEAPTIGGGGNDENPPSNEESIQLEGTPTPERTSSAGSSAEAPTVSRTPTASVTGTRNATPTKIPGTTGTPSRTPTPGGSNLNGLVPTATPVRTLAGMPTATSLLLVPTNTPNDGAGSFVPATATPNGTNTPTRVPRVSRTPTPTKTNTPPAGATPTPSKTSVAVIKESTAVPTRTPVATPTPTQVLIGTPRTVTTPTSAVVLLPTPTNTPIILLPTPTPTPTNTVPPTAVPPTNTPVLPTATNTLPPPTNTPLPTNTPVPPTATDTPTNTPVPPTATDTPTNTPVPPTATDTPTNTPVPPTATDTPTNTPVPPTPPIPPVAEEDRWTTNQEVAVSRPSSELLLNDRDPDGQTVNFAGIVWESVQGGAVSLNPDNTIIFTPAPGFAGEGSFQYEINDGVSAARGTVRITINAVNRDPVFVTQPVSNATAGVAYNYEIVATDADGDVMTISPTTALPGWLTLSPTGNGTAQLSGTPAGPQDSVEVVLVVSDSKGGSSAQPVPITVAPPAPAPEGQSNTVRPASSANAWLGLSFMMGVPIEAGYTVALGQAPDWLRLEPAGEGIVNLVGDQVTGASGPIEIQLVLTDGAGNQKIQTVSLTVIQP